MAKFIHWQDVTQKMKSKGSRNDEVPKTANKRKQRDAVMNPTTKKMKVGEKKASKDKMCDENNRVRHLFPFVHCLWNGSP